MSEQLGNSQPSHEDLQKAVRVARDTIDEAGISGHGEYKGLSALSMPGADITWTEKDSSIHSAVRVANEGQRSTLYKSEAIPPSGIEPSRGVTKIERRDSAGNVIYTHESTDPAMARKVGMITARAINNSAEMVRDYRKAA